MDYYAKIVKTLEKNMSKRGFKLWQEIDKILFNIWNKPTSSTGKYHKKKDGRVPTISEHTYDMLYSMIKLFRVFNYKIQTTNTDTLLLAIVLHDSLKYGQWGNLKHTTPKHDQIIGDIIKSNKDTFRKLLSNDQFNILEEGVRYHAGRWSTDVEDQKNFNWNDYNPTTFLIHILDMLSSLDLIKNENM